MTRLDPHDPEPDTPETRERHRIEAAAHEARLADQRRRERSSKPQS